MSGGIGDGMWFGMLRRREKEATFREKAFQHSTDDSGEGRIASQPLFSGVNVEKVLKNVENKLGEKNSALHRANMKLATHATRGSESRTTSLSTRLSLRFPACQLRRTWKPCTRGRSEDSCTCASAH